MQYLNMLNDEKIYLYGQIKIALLFILQQVKEQFGFFG